MSNTTLSESKRGDYQVLYHGQSVDDLVIKYMQENNIPGLSLAIVQAPYITRVVGYGLADIQSKRLVATHTVFKIGHLTNAFTAVAIMQLKEEGKLTLQDSILHYLTAKDKKWEAITIYDLLTNSSGLPNYTDAPGFDYTKDYTPLQLMALIEDKPLLFSPGTKAKRSNTDSYFLGLIIEKASGMSYQDYVTKNQLERIGLKHTFFISNVNQIKNEANNGSNPFKHKQFLHETDKINPTEVASGYLETKGALTEVKSMSWTSSFASTGMLATSEDISLWDVSLVGDILIKDPKDREFLYHSATLKNNTVVPGNGGWLFPGHKGLMEMKGNVPGYSAFLSRFTASEELLCVTLLANKEGLPDLDILARKIAGAFDSKLAVPTGAAWSETIQSPYSVKETIDRVAAIVTTHGGKVFARMDHGDEAIRAGLPLPATQVLVFGNPAKGTAMMQDKPAMALDLPLRVMATVDNTGQVWLSFIDPVALAIQYKVDAKQAESYKPISIAIRKVCQQAVSSCAL
jgi:D-alanyl-D-alanine carboxypeptidase